MIQLDPKGELFFYPNSGNHHAKDCSKIMLSPSGTASYSTDVTWGYRRAPLLGEQTRDSRVPSQVNAGAVSASAQQPEVP